MKPKQKLIKSKKRVKDFGEVFTPEFIVKDMCDLIPVEIWNNIDSTFLEPSCGNGNFLVEILARKLNLANSENETIRCYKSIYGIDIQNDNVEETRKRLLDMLPNNISDEGQIEVYKILKHNFICGDSLKIMGDIDAYFN